MSPNELTKIEQAALSAIMRAADAGLPCPSNDAFANLLGGEANMGSTVIARLERKGFVQVQRGNSKRVVTIVATGKSTTGKVLKPHWRYRPENAGKVSARAGGRPQKKAKPEVEPEPEIELVRVERDPCFLCGSRPDACQCAGGARV